MATPSFERVCECNLRVFAVANASKFCFLPRREGFERSLHKGALVIETAPLPFHWWDSVDK